MPKFGYLFVFTPDKVMQLNYDFDVLQKVDLGPQSPQILADFDAIKNTVNKIYIQSEALDFKAQEIKDELGYEAEPAAPVYLESKYLYPLGVVKEVKI